MHYDEMVIERDISVKSLCEHHILPIVGRAHVAYIPKDRVLGLSKMPRVVEYFSRRPQIQERLTEQVYHALQYILGTDDIAVTIMAEHMCVSQRGVEDNSASTTTSKLGGCFKTDLAVRTEFFKHVYQ
jgi:GTP cyclohydrolase I